MVIHLQLRAERKWVELKLANPIKLASLSQLATLRKLANLNKLVNLNRPANLRCSIVVKQINPNYSLQQLFQQQLL